MSNEDPRACSVLRNWNRSGLTDGPLVSDGGAHCGERCRALGERGLRSRNVAQAPRTVDGCGPHRCRRREVPGRPGILVPRHATEEYWKLMRASLTLSSCMVTHQQDELAGRQVFECLGLRPSMGQGPAQPAYERRSNLGSLVCLDSFTPGSQRDSSTCLRLSGHKSE